MGILILSIGVLGLIFGPPFLMCKTVYKSSYTEEFFIWIKALTSVIASILVVGCTLIGIDMVFFSEMHYG